jgi:hypothetical protein
MPLRQFHLSEFLVLRAIKRAVRLVFAMGILKSPKTARQRHTQNALKTPADLLRQRNQFLRFGFSQIRGIIEASWHGVSTP